MNALEKLAILAQKGGNSVRATNIVVSLTRDERGGLITMGIDQATLNDLIFHKGDYIVTLFVINKNDLDSVG